MKKFIKYIPLAIIFSAMIFEACSAKKNTAGSRFWQAFTTRYNVYYHGKTNYDEQIKILENDYEDDYSQRVFIHPAESKANPKSPQGGGSFDRTIEKMQKAIAVHSIKKKPKKKAGKGNDAKYKEWLKRDEYNPFLHNAWYWLAKAEYMKGDFLSSAATFHYISRHFFWKPDLVEESKIWEALSYCAMGWTTEADNILAHIHIDQIEDNKRRSLANLAFADYYIKDKRDAEAIPYLAEAIKGFGGAQKVRLNFLLGQLYESVGDKQNAYLAYKRAGSSSGSTYRTKFNARIKQSAVYQGDNIKPEVNSLKSMTRYDRNKDYLDQIYYAIGNLYLSRNDTVNAIENYKLAAEKSTRNGIDKAISQLTLGGVYFAQHKYDLAQPCYAEGITQVNEDYPNYKELKKRSDVLDELAVYAQNVTLQDSLLRLSQLPLEEQKKIIQKIIEDLKKKEKEEAENAAREEYMAQQAAKGQQGGDKAGANAPTTYQMNNDRSWYFYNTANKNAGKTAFQRQWGNRKLEDNWRRRNKATFSLDENTDDDSDLTQNGDSTALASDSTKVDQKAQARADDPHYEEYYLKQIPKTPEEIQTSHDVIQEGLYNEGLILKDKLEDFNAAGFQFSELLRRYPDNIYRLDAYYNLYLMHMRNGDHTQAEYYRSMILSEFPDSKYGQAMQDPNYLENLKNMEKVQERMYEQAYENYLNNNNSAVHAAYAEMMRTYPLSKLMPKFMFIDALAYVTERNYDKFKETLKEMLQRYPETDITPTASSMVKQINQGRQLNGGGENARGMLWTMRLSNDTTAAAIEKEFTPFSEGQDKPQYFILVYSTDSIRSNVLLYEVAKHNFSNYTYKDFDLEQMNFSNLGLLIVKGFDNYAELKNYKTTFDADKELDLPPQVHQVLISEDNFNLLLREGRSFEDYFRYLDEENTKKVEAKVPELKDGDKVDDDQDQADGDDDQKPIKSVKGKKDDKKPKDDKKDKKGKKDDKKGKKDDKKTQEETNVERNKFLKQNQQQQDGSSTTTGEPDPLDVTPTLKTDNSSVVKPVTTVEPDNTDEPDITQPNLSDVDTTTVTPVHTPEVITTPTTDVTTTPTTDVTTTPVTDVNTNINTVEATDSTTQNAQTNLTDPGQKPTRSIRDKKGETEKDREKAAREEAKAREKAEKEAAKAREKAEKEAAKAREKAEKEAAKTRENEQKQREQAEKDKAKLKEQQIKAREDSVKNAQKNREETLKQNRKAREDSVKNAHKAKEEQMKMDQKERADAKKQKEEERKQQLKEKEKERKQKAEERKKRQKEREAERKAYQKQKEKEAKERKKAAEQRRKEKEREAKERAKQRKAERENRNKGKGKGQSQSAASNSGGNANAATGNNAGSSGNTNNSGDPNNGDDNN